jgi:polyketide cyclase/dehydrase/lipid transport protein
MRVEASEVVDRPVGDVFRFCARQHVRNHPRWDPDIELEQISPGPVRVGTIIRRRNSHGGAPVEGTMEIVEYEPDRAFGGVIREGGREYRGGMSFAPEGDERTLLTISADIPGLDQASAAALTGLMERSVRNIKDLIESEPD